MPHRKWIMDAQVGHFYMFNAGDVLARAFLTPVWEQ